MKPFAPKGLSTRTWSSEDDEENFYNGSPAPWSDGREEADDSDSPPEPPCRRTTWKDAPWDAAAEECKAAPNDAKIFTLHTIDAECTATARLGPEELARALAAPVARKAVRWVELDDRADASTAASGLRTAFVGERRLHPLLAKLVERPRATTHAYVEPLPGGWQAWSCLLPLVTPGKRVAFAAAVSEDLVVTTLRPSSEDHSPAGGWWTSKRPKSREGRRGCCGRRRREKSPDALRAPLVEASPSERPFRLSASGADRLGPDSPAIACVRRCLALEADERRRIAALGGAYVCCKLVEGALADARSLFDEMDETVSRLSEVAYDEKGGWRRGRTRFDRTTRMLLEAGTCRTRISRLREYYDQAQVLARQAARLSDRGERGELTPWMRDLANVAHGDLRRLNQIEQLIHSYLMLARLRHDDDYSRVSICLSLVATVFLPLSFVTGVFGMNFKALPYKGDGWSFYAFTAFSLGLTLFFVAWFWWRGWLNVARHAHEKERAASSTLHRDV